ncbi:MAG: M20/M25/M40 family metallo-hydrolase [Bacteroidales bacterium]|nr:M20/M25/M40 family metallo-hydrolase [Bacteroidales bacterium]
MSASINLAYSQHRAVTSENLKEWVSFLASDNMMGRRNGSPEMKLAADWIAGKFSESGLKPVAPSLDFIHNYTFTSRQNQVNERNVIGLIEGSDPALKGEYIVLTAHFDHVGIKRGSKPDSIYNGADDNAAGTAAIIGIAKAIKESGIRPGRSIIFAAFSGEENGMRGSRNFVANSQIPMKKIYANLNFEMIGHSEYLGKKKYYMTGCLLSDLDDAVGEYNWNSGFQLVDTIKLSHILFGSSDNIAFSRISTRDGVTTGIPSGTFATTTMAPHIHNVTDEVSLFDFDNMADLVNHFSGLVLWLSDRKKEIIWTDKSFVRPE